VYERALLLGGGEAEELGKMQHAHPDGGGYQMDLVREKNPKGGTEHPLGISPTRSKVDRSIGAHRPQRAEERRGSSHQKKLGRGGRLTKRVVGKGRLKKQKTT